MRIVFETQIESANIYRPVSYLFKIPGVIPHYRTVEFNRYVAFHNGDLLTLYAWMGDHFALYGNYTKEVIERFLKHEGKSMNYVTIQDKNDCYGSGD